MKIQHVGAEYGEYDVAVEDKRLRGTRSVETISLAGEYLVSLGDDGHFEYKAKLPGSLDLAEIGEPNPERTICSLARRRTYIGKAFYKTTVQIPESYRDKIVELELERVMWVSSVYVDGVLAGSRDSLCTPHRYDLSDLLAPGTHELVFMIDNSERPGANCHGYGYDIQIKWNGADGRIALSAYERVRVEALQVYPDPAGKRIKAEAVIRNATKSPVRIDAEFTVTPKNGAEIVARQAASIEAADERSRLKLYVDFSRDFKKWDEFDPFLHELHCTIRTENGGKSVFESKTTVFGMREFSRDSHHFYLNGNKIWLRGTHDGGGFALTGMTSCDKEEWRRIFRICKSYGLNHVRWHSFCPPEAAFAAADEEGILVQAELPICGNAANGWAGTAFLYNELERILNAYGNHPSFCLFSMGNENGGDWDLLADMVDMAKRHDPRRLYTAASNEYLRPGNGVVPANPGDEFLCNMWGLDPVDGSVKRRLRYFERFSDWSEMVEPDRDYEIEIKGIDLPVVTHELGQWWIYPDYDVTKKINGVLEPRNFEVLQEIAREKGVLDRNKAYAECSGRLAVSLYKEDIEKQLKTKGMAGFQLLDLHDYWGQRTSTVGILDPLWETKGLITPEAFRRFCNHTVVLARIKKYTYFSDETLEAAFEVFRYEREGLRGALPTVTVAGENGEVVFQTCLPAVDIQNRMNTDVGTIAFPLCGVNGPCRLKITLRLEPYGFENDWDVWVYPKNAAVGRENVLIADGLDRSVYEALNSGKNVLLMNHRNPNSTCVGFANAGWNPFIPGRDTTGLVVDASHPVFADFPTEKHAGWQWQSLLNNARGVVLECNTEPIVEAIDGPFEAFKIGILTEWKVGKSTVMLCSLDLEAQTPEAVQLKRAILRYLNGETRPKRALSPEQLNAILEPGQFALADPPQEARTVLRVEACGNTDDVPGMYEWNQTRDKTVIAEDGFSYELRNSLYELCPNARSAPAVCRVELGAKGWSGEPAQNFEIRLTLPDGFRGTVYLGLKNHDGASRYKIVSTERRAYMPEPTRESKRLAIRVGPADVRDGVFTMRFNRHRAYYSDDRLMISELIVQAD